MIQKINELTWFNFLNKLKIILTEISNSSGQSPTWASITGKPTTFAPVIGTTATTAKAGNYTPSATEVTTAIKAMTETQKTEVKTALGIA